MTDLTKIQEHNKQLLIKAFNFKNKPAYFHNETWTTIFDILKLVEENNIIEYFDYLANLKIFKVCSFVNGISYNSALDIINDGWFVNKLPELIEALKANLPPKCERCDVEMQFGIAINATDDNLLSCVPIAKIVDVELINCWKCPNCGHSESIELKMIQLKF